MRPCTSLRSSQLKAVIDVPGDKSISHRSLLITSQAKGISFVSGLLESDDVFATMEALRLLGIDIVKLSDERWQITGKGISAFKQTTEILDMRNTGTGSRLLLGLAAGSAIATSFTGDESLKKRPMGRILEPLKLMGAKVLSAVENDKMPLTILGSVDLKPIEYELPVASAQIKSAILFAGLSVAGKTIVIEPHPTRDHSEKMLVGLGADIKTEELADGKVKITLCGRPELNPANIIVPGDPSSAAFLVVAALITKDSELLIKNICINKHRIGLYITLKEMGANIEFVNKRIVAGEEVADIKVRSSKLHGVIVPEERAPAMIDEYPILAVAASFAEGETVMLGLAELKVKESNRLEVVANNLLACGSKVKVIGDDLYITGQDKIKGGVTVKTFMDHRIAMSFLVMGLVTEQAITVDDISMIDTSFPTFITLIQNIGGSINLA